MSSGAAGRPGKASEAAIGWTPERGVALALAGFGIMLFFSYALSWGCACLGIVSKGPESAQGTGLVILFPLALVSNALVPTQHMPTVLRTIADWNPVSAVTAAARELFGNPNPSASIGAWPMQHPVVAALLWSVALLTVFAPLCDGALPPAERPTSSRFFSRGDRRSRLRDPGRGPSRGTLPRGPGRRRGRRSRPA